jgi:ubiquinone/menaquinone biosynthesis C-methylase UbiE
MSFEKQMYEVKEKWEESYFSPTDKKRIEYIKNIIPNEINTLLDVGCGNGILVNYLQQHYQNDFSRICGVDRSTTSLKFVKTEKSESNIDDLPFKDGEFEMVTCLEVIEHLPLEVYAKALTEIERVSSKYVIISVPYEENLDLSKVACIKCRTEFNPFYHMHSFNEEKVASLFDGSSLRLLGIHKVENHKKPHFGKLKKWISKKIHPTAFPSNCICPMCGYNEFEKLKPLTNNQNSKGSDVSQSKGLSKYWPHYNATKWVAGIFIKDTIV